MRLQAFVHMFSGFLGLLLMWYGFLAMQGKTPMLTVVPLKSEKERQKEYRFQAIGYGGMGLIALLKCIYFFSGWSWAGRLMSASTTVITVYLLYCLTFRVYKKGYIAGDTDEPEENR